MADYIGHVVLFGGPAGAGKTTLARAWCATRPHAAHLELDEVRSLIISGLADPQEASGVQEAQYRLSVEATCALARAFATGGCDVAIDDVSSPTPTSATGDPPSTGFRGSSSSSSPPWRRPSPDRGSGRSMSEKNAPGHSTLAAADGIRVFGSTPPGST